MAYSKEKIESTFEEICSMIEQGSSLRAVLRSDGMPSSKTFYEWVDSDEEKVKRYARACEFRADEIFEDMLEIADTAQEGVTIKETEKGTETTTGDMIQHRRLRVDTRKWMLAKMNPKKYGDRTINDVNLKSTPEQEKTDDELNDRLNQLISNRKA